MADTIVPIRQGIEPAPSEAQIDDEVVADLEALLSKAKAGEIIGFAYACVCPGDLTSFYSVGRLTRGVIGTLEILKHQLCQDSLED